MIFKIYDENGNLVDEVEEEYIASEIAYSIGGYYWGEEV